MSQSSSINELALAVREELKAGGRKVPYNALLQALTKTLVGMPYQALRAQARPLDAPRSAPQEEPACDPADLVLDPQRDYVLEEGPEGRSSVWIGAGCISVHLIRNDEGVIVDLYKTGDEMGDSLASTWLQVNDVAQDSADDGYDGSYVENHCPECGEYESECLCGQQSPRRLTLVPRPSLAQETLQSIAQLRSERWVGTAEQFLAYVRAFGQVLAAASADGGARGLLDYDAENRGVFTYSAAQVGEVGFIPFESGRLDFQKPRALSLLDFDAAQKSAFDDALRDLRFVRLAHDIFQDQARIASEELDNYLFGDGLEMLERGSFAVDHDADRDDYLARVVLQDVGHGEPFEVSFHVKFAPDSLKVLDVYALTLDSGSEIGTRG